jgi:hypothetical protein
MLTAPARTLPFPAHIPFAAVDHTTTAVLCPPHAAMPSSLARESLLEATKTTAASAHWALRALNSHRRILVRYVGRLR